MMTTLTATTAQQAPLDVVTLGEAMAMFVAAQTGDLAEVKPSPNASPAPN